MMERFERSVALVLYGVWLVLRGIAAVAVNVGRTVWAVMLGLWAFGRGVGAEIRRFSGRYGVFAEDDT